jgi:Flp pilus assembly pilin Flp
MKSGVFMSYLFSLLFSYLPDKRGATATEYALIAAGISIVLIVSIYAFGDELEALYNETLPGALEGEE